MYSLRLERRTTTDYFRDNDRRELVMELIYTDDEGREQIEGTCNITKDEIIWLLGF